MVSHGDASTAAQPAPAGGAGPDPMQVAEAEAKEAVAAGQ